MQLKIQLFWKEIKGKWWRGKKGLDMELEMLAKYVKCLHFLWEGLAYMPNLHFCSCEWMESKYEG